MISIHVKSRQVTSSHGFAAPRSLGKLIIAVIKLERARSLGDLASSARRARGVFPLDMIPLVLPDPAKARPAPGSHPVGVAGSDQIVRRAAV
jgi:hypothetical protein